jgi:hypothetical protein
MAPRRRKNPKANRLGSAPEGTDVEAVAAQAVYVGSPEHKSTPSFAGQPRPRADATICDPAFHDRQADLQQWLRNAIRNRQFNDYWEKGFPRYVWSRVGDTVFIARHTGNGQYKGWQLEDQDEGPEGLA